MVRNGLLDGKIGGHVSEFLNPGPADMAILMQDADAALDRDNPERTDVTGEPILMAPDIASQVRLPNLIPEEWEPALTDMIMKAVDQDEQPSGSGF